jgi:hypothetical protein
MESACRAVDSGVIFALESPLELLPAMRSGACLAV